MDVIGLDRLLLIHFILFYPLRSFLVYLSAAAATTVRRLFPFHADRRLVAAIGAGIEREGRGRNGKGPTREGDGSSSARCRGGSDDDDDAEGRRRCSGDDSGSREVSRRVLPCRRGRRESQHERRAAQIGRIGHQRRRAGNSAEEVEADEDAADAAAATDRSGGIRRIAGWEVAASVG